MKTLAAPEGADRRTWRRKIVPSVVPLFLITACSSNEAGIDLANITFRPAPPQIWEIQRLAPNDSWVSVPEDENDLPWTKGAAKLVAVSVRPSMRDRAIAMLETMPLVKLTEAEASVLMTTA